MIRHNQIPGRLAALALEGFYVTMYNIQIMGRYHATSIDLALGKVHGNNMWISLTISNTAEIDPAIRKAFENRSRVIEDMFNMYFALSKVKIKGVKKISITLVDQEGVNSIAPPITGFSPVANIRKFYDLQTFKILNSNDQDKAILNLIESNLLEVSEKFNWHIQDVIKSTAKKIKESEFKHSYIEIKPKISKNKKYRASVEVSMAPGYAVISILLNSVGNDVVKKIELIKVHPNRLFIKPLVGKSNWLNDNEFEVVDQNNEIHFKLFIDKGVVNLYFTPRSRSEEQLIDEILVHSIDTRKELAEKILKDKIDRV